MTSFVDTNIFLYSIDPADEAKRAIARAILEKPDCVISLQVLNEFVVRATRLGWPPSISFAAARTATTVWCDFTVQPLDLTVFTQAWEVERRTNYSWWDCTIIAAAIVSGCRRVLSEDMQHGHIIDGVRIENPFRDLG